MRRRQILFTESVARMEDTILPYCVMPGELVKGCGQRGKAGKRVGMGCLPDDLRAFSINADQWTSADQDEGEWRKTAEQGVERLFHGEMDHCRESQAWTTACSRMPGRDRKD